MIRGVDVSAVQGPHVLWSQLATEDIRFVFAKCGEGNRPGYDPCFAGNVTAARAAGLLVAPYHFVYPLPTKAGEPLREPAAQARHHFELAGGKPGLAAIDLEWPAPQDFAKWGCTPSQIREWCKAYLAASEALHGSSPLVYTYPDWWTRIGGAQEPAFARYPLWMASYPHPDRWPTDGEQPTVPKPWTSATFWQFSDGKAFRLPGGAPVDSSVFLGSEDELRGLMGAPASTMLPVAPVLAIEQPTPPGDRAPAS